MMTFDVSRRWSLYLKLCVTVFSSENVGLPGATVLFSVEPIILEWTVRDMWDRSCQLPWRRWSLGDAAEVAAAAAVAALEAAAAGEGVEVELAAVEVEAEAEAEAALAAA